ncbi:diguanylate cyclase [Pseudodesulfovibrio sp. zrk46]|uniref:diguanylate cyclase n=1 Tax=Pseudodesulfovibrio sp. zrk46 TaxID=2725288 RepID=UPI001449C910|nr:diguanylate cyclase [Pseudodesulfovibrio sp. zrk46]QJB55433.1 diguanylate cyclase [Pseudodesulfovibrio sp. zrk46]
MTDTPPTSRSRTKHRWVQYMIQVSLLVTIFVTGLYAGVYVHDKQLIQDQIKTDARAIFQSIVLTRMWNAMHGGVYVEKKPGVETNPYLENPEIVTKDGRILTKRNPAMMTREISELADRHSLFQYRITSLNPLNPGNTPDIFERKALEEFSRGKDEAFTEEERDGKTYFRYMAPLIVTQDCLPCHAKQNYKLGDVRGGISVAKDITQVKNAMRSNQHIIIGLIVVTTVLLLGTFSFFSLRLRKQLYLAQEKLAVLAVTDELTGLSNRRHFFRRFDEEVDRARRYGSTLSLILIDIDHFKKVNDTYGHPVGDMVLKEVARLLNANIRTSDILARYGGEEFAILIPSQTAPEARQAAEKLRNVIEVNDMVMDGPEVRVTISAGVADIEPLRSKGGNMKDKLIQNADRALYRAKAEGRNRIEVHVPSSETQLKLK